MPATLMTTVLIGVFWFTGVLAQWPFMRADYHMAMRNHGEAIRWSQWARSLNGDGGRVEWIQARVSRRWNDFEAMERHLVAGLANGLDVSTAQRERTLATAQSGRLDEVRQQMQQWIAAPGNDVADIADAYAAGLNAYGRTKEAKLILVVWSADCPNDPKPHLELARIAEAQSRPDDAGSGFRQALELNPNYPPALYAMAQWHAEHRQPQQALALLEQCRRQDPQSGLAVDGLAASCHRVLGELEQAREMLERVLRSREQNIERAYLRVSVRPVRGRAEYEMGMLEFAQQEYATAAGYFRLAIRQAGEYNDAEFQLGNALSRLGQTAEAQEILDRVINRREKLATLEPFAARLAQDPDDVEARFQMGAVLLESGHAERGLFHLNSVLANVPDHAAAHRRLADYYAAHQSDKPEYAELAEQHRQILASISPSAPPAPK